MEKPKQTRMDAFLSPKNESSNEGSGSPTLDQDKTTTDPKQVKLTSFFTIIKSSSKPKNSESNKIPPFVLDDTAVLSFKEKASPKPSKDVNFEKSVSNLNDSKRIRVQEMQDVAPNKKASRWCPPNSAQERFLSKSVFISLVQHEDEKSYVDEINKAKGVILCHVEEQKRKELEELAKSFVKNDLGTTTPISKSKIVEMPVSLPKAVVLPTNFTPIKKTVPIVESKPKQSVPAPIATFLEYDEHEPVYIELPPDEIEEMAIKPFSPPKATLTKPPMEKKKPKKKGLIIEVPRVPILKVDPKPVVNIPKYHIPKSKELNLPTIESSDEEPESPVTFKVSKDLTLEVTPSKTPNIPSPSTPQYTKPNEKAFEDHKVSKIPIRFNSALEYQNFFSKLLDVEMSDMKSRISNKIRDSTTKQLVADGVCLTGLTAKIKHTKLLSELLQIEFKMPGDDKERLPRHNFFNGCSITICPHKQTPVSSKTIDGSVVLVTDYYIVVNAKSIPKDLLLHRWRIDEAESKVSFDRMKSALEEMLVSSLEEEDSRPNIMSDLRFLNHTIKSCTSLGNIILAKSFDENILEKPIFKVDKNFRTILKDDHNCNDSMIEAIETALYQRLALIQGPPGAGKTTTTVEYIRLFVESKSEYPILATAYTNIAVDNLMERCLARGLKCLRIGMPSKIAKNLLENTMETVCEKDPELIKILSEEENIKQTGDKGQIQSIRKKLEARKKKRVDQIIYSYQVICVTAIAVGDPSFAHLKFPVVVVDEATQCIEPATLVPLLHGSQQAVLVGDHFQLPPSIQSQKAHLWGLGKSLFERLIDAGLTPSTLNVQYRMHPGISYWPAKNFYNGLLFDGVSQHHRAWIYPFKLANEKVPIMFYDYPLRLGGERKVNEEKMINETELEIVDELLNMLIKNDVPKSDIAIISMYAAQVESLKRRITHEEVEIKSVDGFQGREKQVVILSLVRANSGGMFGFLSDWRRMNVAITRAKRGLFIVGHRETIDNEPRWRSYINYLGTNKCVLQVEKSVPLTVYTENK